MGSSGPDEYFALSIAALVLALVLVISYMCLQLYRTGRPSGAHIRNEGFLSCSPCLPEYARAANTSGQMPVIECDSVGACMPCCGGAQVPP
jgi:hypothetical protein